VDEQRGERPDVRAKVEPVSFSRLRINHYFTKSEAEWREKSSKPMAANGKMRGTEIQEDLDAVRDETITAYVPALRAALADIAGSRVHAE
jgi:hypothetical protein